jgi:cell division protein FtsN
MNFTLIIIAAVVVIIGLIVFSIWLNKKGITKDDNNNYIPDVLEDKVKDLKTKVKDIKNIVKNKK